MSVNYNSKIITDGLVLCLDAANPKSYPGSGTTWKNVSGGNLTAIKAGSQSPTYPQYNSNNNGYFTFTGGVFGNNYSRFYVSNIPSFSALSVFAWYKTTNGDSKTLLRMNNSDFEISINGIISYCSAGTHWNDINVSVNISNSINGNWHHIGLTFTGRILNSYFDGRYTGTNTRASPTTTAAGFLNIGTRDDANAQHFVGDISQISIYNRVLSDAEIQQNFNALRGRYGI